MPAGAGPVPPKRSQMRERRDEMGLVEHDQSIDAEQARLVGPHLA
jgi:hypothetical protein